MRSWRHTVHYILSSSTRPNIRKCDMYRKKLDGLVPCKSTRLAPTGWCCCFIKIYYCLYLLTFRCVLNFLTLINHFTYIFHCCILQICYIFQLADAAGKQARSQRAQFRRPFLPKHERNYTEKEWAKINLNLRPTLDFTNARPLLQRIFFTII